MNIVEAYRKAVACKGQIKSQAGHLYTITKCGDIVTNFNTACPLTAGWLSGDDFEVIEPPKPKVDWNTALAHMVSGGRATNPTTLHGDYERTVYWFDSAGFFRYKTPHGAENTCSLSKYLLESKEWELT